MSRDVQIVVEGPTEQFFIEQVLAPDLAIRGLYLRASQLGHVGHKGGNVRFDRASYNITAFLKQRPDTIVCTFFDYYGLETWPRLGEARGLSNPDPKTISDILNEAAVAEIEHVLPDIPVRNRFIPFTAVHEFEALLFSNPETLAAGADIPVERIRAALAQCGNAPERIDNGPATAPSKRLETWSDHRYGKTTTGISIAKRIGIETMREACPLFDAWLIRLEKTAASNLREYRE